MSPRTSYTVKLDAAQQQALSNLLKQGNYNPVTLPPYAMAAGEGDHCKIVLYASGKCVIQGKGTEDWITFVLEPNILGEARLGYEDVVSPDLTDPHMGVDESGKGDFFGPLVIAAAYVDADIVPRLRALNVRDSKTITSDRKAEEMAAAIMKVLGRRFAVVKIGPAAYNRLYAKMGSVNQMLAWGHARAIEDLLEQVPDCPRALSDQFGPTRQIERALLQKGRHIKLDQRPKAESDPAVAAASVLARAGFLRALREQQNKYGIPAPKGASPQVKEAARELVRAHGPGVLLESAKCHFKTADDVLAAEGRTRAELGPLGSHVSKAARKDPGEPA